MKKSIALIGVAALVSLSGCYSSSRVHNEPSVGQQLLDLDKSYKDGIITQKDYERLKKAIIRKND